MLRPKALVLLATGTNRDWDAAEALNLAGADPQRVPLNDLRAGRTRWQDFQLLVVPGGFSYADALGAGKLLAVDLNTYFAEEISRFVDSGKPVIGICNGFQALVKAGILPGKNAQPSAALPATLTFNQCGHFECRWVTLMPVSQRCLWTRSLEEAIECPVAHGEGNFVPSDEKTLAQIQRGDQVALIYANARGETANGIYPANPNGSVFDIAGVTNEQGNVLGLMPHPENHIYPYQHPRWTRGQQRASGLPLFENGVLHARQM